MIPSTVPPTYLPLLTSTTVGHYVPYVLPDGKNPMLSTFDFSNFRRTATCIMTDWSNSHATNMSDPEIEIEIEIETEIVWSLEFGHCRTTRTIYLYSYLPEQV